MFTSFFSITCLSHVRRIFKIDGLTIVAGSAVSTHMEHTTSRNEYKANNKSEKYGQQPQWNVMDQWTTQSLYTFYIYMYMYRDSFVYIYIYTIIYHIYILQYIYV